MDKNLDNVEKVTLDDAEQTMASAAAAAAVAADTVRADTATIQNPECDTLAAKVTELNDKYLRLAAELENTRRRAQLDMESVARNRAMSVAQNFLPVMDAIDAALIHSPNDTGINAMAQAMQAAFAQVGLVKIESVGQILNPMYHNAIQVVDVPPSDCPCAAKNIPNTVVGEMQTGYLFGDSVLRPAMVIVCK